MQSIRNLLLSGFLFISAVTIVTATHAADDILPAAKIGDLPQKFDPSRDALADLKIAINLARSQHKRILVDVGGDWCAGCIELENFFNDNPNIKTLRDKNFVYLRINYSPENENKKVISKFSWFIGYPHWFLLDETGKQLDSSFPKDNADGFMKFVKEWATPQ